MEVYKNNIDTDRAIGDILSNFETPWILHSVSDSLQMRFRPFSEPMPNYVDLVNRQLDSVLYNAPDYRNKVEDVKFKTNVEIIEAICDFYNLNFTKSFDEIHPVELYGISHTLYDIFVSRFTDYMVDFFIRYIIDNMDSIYSYLTADGTKKPKEKDLQGRNYIDPKYYVIHANLNTIVLNMASYDIPLNLLLRYFLAPNVAPRMIELLEDRQDIFKNYYAIYLLDQRYMANLLTVIKLNMQAKTQEIFQINTKE